MGVVWLNLCCFSPFSPFLWNRDHAAGTEMAGWHHWLDGRESGWTPGVGDEQGGLACCDSWGRKESDTTERLNWTELSGSWLRSLWLGSSRNKLFSQKRLVLSLQVVWTIWIASCLNWAVWTVSCLAVRKWSFYSTEKPLRNEVPVILIFWGWLPIGTPVDFIFKNHGPSQWALLTKWTDLTKGSLDYQSYYWERLISLNLISLKPLDNNSSKISRSEWNAYID